MGTLLEVPIHRLMDDLSLNAATKLAHECVPYALLLSRGAHLSSSGMHKQYEALQQPKLPRRHSGLTATVHGVLSTS